MLYGWVIAASIFLMILIVYIYNFKSNSSEIENIMEDIPAVNASHETLENHAHELSSHYSSTKHATRQRKLIRSLNKSYEEIISSYEYISKVLEGKRELVPAAEWLLDNFYLIEKEYKDIKYTISRNYFGNLPVIDKGIMKGYPRIYSIAAEIISRIDGRISEDEIETFISAYQRDTILLTAELWALPVMLRIAIIQNINKVVKRIVFSVKEKLKGEKIAERIIEAVNSKSIEDELKNIHINDFNEYLAERLLKVLRDSGIENSDVYSWIDENVQKEETSVDRIANLEHQKQAEYQVSIGNCITGIKEIHSFDWKANFQRLSYVEHILSEDPAQIYKNMDFESKDYYRHMIEKISKISDMPESFVARKALKCANKSKANDKCEYKEHIGYYLIDDGISELKTELGCKGNMLERFKSSGKKKSVNIYISTIIITTILLDIIACVLSINSDSSPEFWKYIIIAICALIPLSEIVISFTNWSISHIVEPRFIPKMEFNFKIPDKFRTIVAIPAILNDVKKVHELISDMEVYYLGNQEKNIYFALLGDFKDSIMENEQGDKLIIDAALNDIKALNKNYSHGEDIFYFFSRYRKYNKKQDKWMGWERKRGKLMEFNLLLRGSKDTSYDMISGDIDKLQNTKYVITLDADTQLPRNSAKRLIGAMAHILNRPYVDKKSKKVLRGHGLMQPRISVGTVNANKTFFSRLFSGETGIDIYTTAISDVYEDLFDEGVFTGKGIYDIDTFNEVLSDEIPENSVLSHDLLEGSYSRAALLTDVELIDGYPANYISSRERLHRWVRGDWQLIPWILKSSPLNSLSRWKLIDNLRRSLLSPTIIILTVISLELLPSMEEWLMIAFISLLFPVLFNVSESVVSPAGNISTLNKINSCKITLERFLLVFCFLPYNAYIMADAIIRTSYRLFISKRNLLEWKTAADSEASSHKSLKGFIYTMWSGCIIALIILGIAFARSMEAVMLMLPSCILWFISPSIAYYISSDKKMERYNISDSHKKMLRRIARKVWAYFEDFVASEDNYLAPDNFQEEPANGIAHRTSPTNMAMGLISNVAAHDLGYIGILETVERVDKIINSMEGLEKYNGHFYNWYDTKTCEPLSPRYISTVDSGNLIGYLWTLSVSLEEYVNEPIINKNEVEGLFDTIRLAQNEIEEELGKKNYYSEFLINAEGNQFNLVSWKKILMDLWSKAIEVDGTRKVKLYWNDKVKHSVSRFLMELQKLLPWTNLLSEIQSKYESIYIRLNELPSIVSLKTMSCEINAVKETINNLKINSLEDNELNKQLTELIDIGKDEIDNFIIKIKNINDRIMSIADATNFTMLYNEKRQLFSIGYNIERDALDNCYYDLLASEARQASFVAIAKGDVEQKHWFKLGRSMALMGKSKGLVSWSGTMFEYFMPLLIMKSYPQTLLNETYEAVIEGQKKYCGERKVPWGISESAFYSFDISKNYQYKAFGVPGIGLKRGLKNELVISPYSTIMALMIDTSGGIANIDRLIEDGLEGQYGLFEAVDFTGDRTAKKKAIIKCFMVHHEGMSIMSLDNVLNNNILQNRFHSMPRVKATELLLQEKMPKRVIYDREVKYENSNATIEKQNLLVRKYTTNDTDIPETSIMSNGSLSIMITNSGSGYSKKDDITLYRWHEDVTADDKGMFFYIKNLNSNEYWSASYEPSKIQGDEYEVSFSLDKAEFRRKDGNISTYSEITISHEDDAEIRRMTITNHSKHTRELEITSYAEITLAPYNADLVHPAFSNLFINTEYIDNPLCIIANRRPRAKKQEIPWIFETIAIEEGNAGNIQYETSRTNFIGRGRTLQNPEVMEEDAPLKGGVGAVLDPIISIRIRIKLAPGKSAKVAYTIGTAVSREEAIALAKKYREIQNISRIFELSWTETQVEMKYLGIKSAQANLYQLMASRILFVNPLLRKREEYIKCIASGQRTLWRYGISGDLPILLVHIKQKNDIEIVRQVLNAHEYLSIKGLKIDIVLYNDEVTSYIQPVQDDIRDIISSSHLRNKINCPGGIYILNTSSISHNDISLLMGISRLVIDGEKYLFAKQLTSAENKETGVHDLIAEDVNYDYKPYEYDLPKLEFFNDFGGFDTKNYEYVIRLKGSQNTPAPWINVISNGNFGFHISESGASYTWYKNSRENKITNWSNDPIIDGESEELYMRDEISGRSWSISPKPVRDSGEYIIKHGFGYSEFLHEHEGILGNLILFVPINKNVKVCIVKLKNITHVPRNISVTYYGKLVLGVAPEQTAQYISTYIDSNEEYMYARNPYSDYFGNLLCYLKCYGGRSITYTGNRKEFLGRGGNIRSPEALLKNELTGDVGAGFDPCIALNAKIDLNAFEEKSMIILLGEDESKEEAEKIMSSISSLELANAELDNVKRFWSKMIGTIKVKTPDTSMNILLNGWLIYQVLSCRIWARTAFYQSGGAYGFRDQLQDVMALEYVDSTYARNQIINSASRQYIEGDVQHWWHPVINSGIRTRFSDDLLWLPYVTCDYIDNTGDFSILDEEAGYLEDEPLRTGEDERYNIVGESEKKGSIYEHCVASIERSLKFGEHNIPLMGSGDWNDGMSTVGNKGKGESVWLGWFMYSILDKFVNICKYKSDFEKADKYERIKEFIKENLEMNAWDGSWYRRAYFDDGTPLGSVENAECKIDSISQSWAVICGAAKESRAKSAISAMEKYLVQEDKGVVLLLTPPFDKSDLEPGYIKGYVPGVRENGGQYTHAAVWACLAMTKLGYGNKAFSIFNMINPINHSKTFLDCERYKVEPYVMAADIYTVGPHEGRGGWTWYTGAAGWMYRTGIEGILGLKLKSGKGFTIEPCIPDFWNEYEITYVRGKCTYEIHVIRGDDKGIKVDNQEIEDKVIPFLESGTHEILVTI